MHWRPEADRRETTLSGRPATDLTQLLRPPSSLLLSSRL